MRNECNALSVLSAIRRLADKFNRTAVNDWWRTRFSADQGLRKAVLFGLRGLQRGNRTRSLMSCNSNSQREIEVVGRVDLKHPPLG